MLAGLLFFLRPEFKALVDGKKDPFLGILITFQPSAKIKNQISDFLFQLICATSQRLVTYQLFQLLLLLFIFTLLMLILPFSFYLFFVAVFSSKKKKKILVPIRFRKESGNRLHWTKQISKMEKNCAAAGTSSPPNRLECGTAASPKWNALKCIFLLLLFQRYLELYSHLKREKVHNYSFWANLGELQNCWCVPLLALFMLR